MMDRFDKARRVAESAATMAKNPDERRDAATRLADARQQQEQQKKMEDTEAAMNAQSDGPELPELRTPPNWRKGSSKKRNARTARGSTSAGKDTVRRDSPLQRSLPGTALHHPQLYACGKDKSLSESRRLVCAISYRAAKDPANPGEMMAVVLVKD